MSPDLESQIRRQIRENERAIKRAEQQGRRIERALRESERRTSRARQQLRKAGYS